MAAAKTVNVAKENQSMMFARPRLRVAKPNGAKIKKPGVNINRLVMKRCPVIRMCAVGASSSKMPKIIIGVSHCARQRHRQTKANGHKGQAKTKILRAKKRVFSLEIGAKC